MSRVRSRLRGVVALAFASALLLAYPPVASAAPDPVSADQPKALAVIADLDPVYRIRTKDPVVFITIDDGVFKNPRARDLVERRKVPITSFLTAWTIQDRSRYFERVSGTGSIQNHSATHASFSKISTDLDHEICYTQRKISSKFDEPPWMLRPPYGMSADSPRVRAVARRCGIEHIVMWDTVVEDGQISYRSGKLRKGSIILLHYGKDLDKDLRAALRAARKAGLTPANLAEYLPRLT